MAPMFILAQRPGVARFKVLSLGFRVLRLGALLKGSIGAAQGSLAILAGALGFKVAKV